MGRDSNLNGFLDGDETLDNNLFDQAFQTVNKDIAEAGATMDIRVRFLSNGSHEEMNFDNITVSAVTMVPEPSTVSSLGLAATFMLLRRRRKA
ncbi:PEP-CTERM sorting domain-containing protein [Rubritalea tangerina]|uniref:PEP-CTERM sorting domain-containing protein n=1 Tax=Rubritalea tangerina TaxID=430798 RepID=A0ABW4ZDA1_9BACT